MLASEDGDGVARPIVAEGKGDEGHDEKDYWDPEHPAKDVGPSSTPPGGWLRRSFMSEGLGFYAKRELGGRASMSGQQVSERVAFAFPDR